MTLATAMGQFDMIDRDCKRLFRGGLLQCMSKIGSFAKQYRNLGNDEERSRALLGLLITLGQDG